MTTLASLNSADNAAEVGGKLLGNDGQGNQLWLFGEKVANRHEDDDGNVDWSDDIAGWNYGPGAALD
jgi:hypothetical protein